MHDFAVTLFMNEVLQLLLESSSLVYLLSYFLSASVFSLGPSHLV